MAKPDQPNQFHVPSSVIWTGIASALLAMYATVWHYAALPGPPSGQVAVAFPFTGGAGFVAGMALAAFARRIWCRRWVSRRPGNDLPYTRDV